MNNDCCKKQRKTCRLVTDTKCYLGVESTQPKPVLAVGMPVYSYRYGSDNINRADLHTHTHNTQNVNVKYNTICQALKGNLTRRVTSCKQLTSESAAAANVHKEPIDHIVIARERTDRTENSTITHRIHKCDHTYSYSLLTNAVGILGNIDKRSQLVTEDQVNARYSTSLNVHEE